MYHDVSVLASAVLIPRVHGYLNIFLHVNQKSICLKTVETLRVRVYSKKRETGKIGSFE